MWRGRQRPRSHRRRSRCRTPRARRAARTRPRGRRQRLAPAGALCADEWVAADHEPLTGELLGGDLGEVDLVKQRRLKRPVTCGALSAVIHSTPSVSLSASRLARVTIPRSATSTSSESPKRRFGISGLARVNRPSRRPAPATGHNGRTPPSDRAPKSNHETPDPVTRLRHPETVHLDVVRIGVALEQHRDPVPR